MVDNVTFISQLKESGNLESWLDKQPEESFPFYDSGNGQKSFPDRYRDLKNKLLPLHGIVEKGALVKSAESQRDYFLSLIEGGEQSCEESSKEIGKSQSSDNFEPLIYLNQHGKGHVENVISKAYEMLLNFQTESLSAFEVFILLCAIQVHDTGNVYGRKNHEHNMEKATTKEVQSVISDEVIRKCMVIRCLWWVGINRVFINRRCSAMFRARSKADDRPAYSETFQPRIGP